MYPPLCLTIPYTIDSPRPVPLPDFLGGVERFEDARLGLRAHALAGIADRQHHVSSGHDRAGSRAYVSSKLTFAVSNVTLPP